jgi:hypothetical protein
VICLGPVDCAERSPSALDKTGINVPKTVLYRRLKEGELRVHNRNIKPFLTDENKWPEFDFVAKTLFSRNNSLTQ